MFVSKTAGEFISAFRQLKFSDFFQIPFSFSIAFSSAFANEEISSSLTKYLFANPS